MNFLKLKKFKGGPHEFSWNQKKCFRWFPMISRQRNKTKLFSKGIENLYACFDHISCEIMQSTTLQEKFFNLQLLLPTLSNLTVVLCSYHYYFSYRQCTGVPLDVHPLQSPQQPQMSPAPFPTFESLFALCASISVQLFP